MATNADGTYLFGGIGLLGLPITIALLHALNKEGAIHLYKMTDDEPAHEDAEYQASPPAEAALVVANPVKEKPQAKPQKKKKTSK